MEETFSALPTPDALFSQYDQQRRLALNRTILPIYLGVDALGILAVVATPTGASYAQLGNLYPVEVGISVALLIMLGLAYLVTLHQHVALGTNLGIISVVLTISSSQVFNLLGGAQGTFIDIVLFTAFGVAIVMAGGVGARWMVLLTTLWLNLLTLGSLLYLRAHLPPQIAASQQAMTLVVQELIYQWAFAGLILGILTGYRRVIRDIGDLRYSVERARRLDQLKDQFISSVNHELRNPIMAMQGHLALLERAIQRQRAYSDLIPLAANANRICDDLAAVVESILEIRNDPSAQPFIPVAVPLRETIHRAIHLIDPREGQLVEREVHLRMSESLAVWGDRIRVQQVLINLFSNALKYSAPGTPIDVAASVVQPPEGGRRHREHAAPMMELRVRDYGLGIPPDQASLLFSRFVRLPRDMQSPVLGNGLGLYLSRLLVESMGGTIGVESSGIEGEGSIFFVRLPLPPDASGF